MVRMEVGDHRAEAGNQPGEGTLEVGTPEVGIRGADTPATDILYVHS